jgi:peroxiredoxin Q/BCP
MKSKLVLALLLLCPLIVRAAETKPIDFTLESPTDNKTLKSTDLRGKYVALHFLLKTECPFCLRHTHEYATKSATLPNVTQVFIKPDSAAEIKSWAAKLKLAPEFPRVTIYRDPDAQLAKKFNIPGGYQFHGQSVHYPALILLDPEGREIFRHVGKDNGDRYSIDQLKLKLAGAK